MTDDSMWFADPDGNRIDVFDWSRRIEDLAGRTVSETEVRLPNNALATVRTLWQGIVEPSISGHRLFGTAVAYHLHSDGRTRFHEVARYDTKDDAEKGHADIVVLLREGAPVMPRF